MSIKAQKVILQNLIPAISSCNSILQNCRNHLQDRIANCRQNCRLQAKLQSKLQERAKIECFDKHSAKHLIYQNN